MSGRYSCRNTAGIHPLLPSLTGTTEFPTIESIQHERIPVLGCRAPSQATFFSREIDAERGSGTLHLGDDAAARLRGPWILRISSDRQSPNRSSNVARTESSKGRPKGGLFLSGGVPRARTMQLWRMLTHAPHRLAPMQAHRRSRRVAQAVERGARLTGRKC